MFPQAAEGKPQELMPISASFAPINASRYLSLTQRLGEDDMFSNDLTESELRSRLGHVDVPTMIVLSGSDEYVPPSVAPRELGSRLLAALAPCEGFRRLCIIPGANHALDGHEGVFVDLVADFLRSLS